jgi:hypothetical protein
MGALINLLEEGFVHFFLCQPLMSLFANEKTFIQNGKKRIKDR